MNTYNGNSELILNGDFERKVHAYVSVHIKKVLDTTMRGIYKVKGQYFLINDNSFNFKYML